MIMLVLNYQIHCLYWTAMPIDTHELKARTHYQSSTQLPRGNEETSTSRNEAAKVLATDLSNGPSYRRYVSAEDSPL